ncbi:MAG: hypothetical protein ACLP8S_12845 [Solirubrobacteraceae bacterium]
MMAAPRPITGERANLVPADRAGSADVAVREVVKRYGRIEALRGVSADGRRI